MPLRPDRPLALPQRLYAVGFSARKQPYLRLCLPGVDLAFVPRLEAGPAPRDDAGVVVWGAREDGDVLAQFATVLRVEDGFLRSVGLGSDLVRPLSWVVDRRGIYFDPRQPSDLEHLLSHGAMGPALLEQAARLREAVVAAGLTKYNVGAERWQRPRRARKVVLVPGQVETDAALICGATTVRTNIGLLRAVRQAEPAAHLVYKPHPDVVARLRAPGAGEEQASAWCDEIVVDAPMNELIEAVDELHVMTSLAGFEGLLRGKPVVCHGRPFYSGWGLTRDIDPPPRRSRRLTLDELTAGALIAYPLYFDRNGTRLVTPQQAVDTLVHWKRTAGGTVPWWRQVSRVVLRHVVGVR
jgi:capsular polysaccharide export protein